MDGIRNVIITDVIFMQWLAKEEEEIQPTNLGIEKVEKSVG